MHPALIHPAWYAVLWTAALVLPIHAAAAMESPSQPPTTDPAALRLLVETARSGANAFDVTFDRRVVDDHQDGTPERWQMVMDGRGVRLDRFHGSGATAEHPFWHYSRQSGLGTAADEAGLRTSTDTERIGVGALLTELESFLGRDPFREAMGEPYLLNDVMGMLADPGCTIQPEMELRGGHECIVVECTSVDGLGQPYRTMRGFFAPALNYAQLKLEWLGGDGALKNRWISSDFMDVGNGGPAFPLSGLCEVWDPATGRLVSSRKYEVAKNTNGTPMIHFGSTVDSGFLVASKSDGTGASVAAASLAAVGFAYVTVRRRRRHPQTLVL